VEIKMTLKKLDYVFLSVGDMIENSKSFLENIIQRRTVRDFSDKPVPIEIIENAIKSASSAPSGANKQPWHFVIVKDPVLKKEIRIAAEKEEKEFYEHRASDDWLEDLNQFGTDWHKPFLEIAPYLIVVFKQSYDLGKRGKRKNYYVNESVGIASGFLLTALHNAGLATLTHTPSPMGFLEKILKRPKNEKAVLLIPVGYPAENAKVPDLKKKSFQEVVTII
jgi:nitroreductase